jgi:hypothetical protein
VVRAVTLAALIALAGCATCHRHPDRCAIAATVAAGLIIAGVGARDWHSTKVSGPGTRQP